MDLSAIYEHEGKRAEKEIKIGGLQIMILIMFRNKCNFNLRPAEQTQLCHYTVVACIHHDVPDSKWQEVQGEANMKVTRAEAQTWLALRHLLLDPRCPAHYDINEYRKNQLLKVSIKFGME
jgi:hypothetical protein